MTGAPGKRAVVVGATGLVGSEILRRLLDDDRFSSVVVLGRRPTGLAHPKLREHVVDFRAPASFGQLVTGDVLFSALGTTLRAAGSRRAQHEVDHGHQYRVAQAARQHGVDACVLVSAAGASPRSPIFYSRMKAELERDVEALGFTKTCILRPGLLDGERREPRRGERCLLRLLRPIAPLLPARLRPIHASVVARAAIRAALDPAPGVVLLPPRALFRLGR